MSMLSIMQGAVNLLETAQFEPGKPKKAPLGNIDGVHLIQLTVKAGDEVPSHHVDKAAFAVLLKGRATFPIEDRRHQVMTGAFLEIPKNAEHAIMAEEDSVFLVGIVGASAD